jgi:hypothetical protein
MGNDVRIINAPKISQAFLKSMGDGGDGNKINLVMVTNINQTNLDDHLYPNPFEDKQIVFDFETFLESLDPPRLKTLIDMAVKVALKKNGVMHLAEEWLGKESCVVRKGPKRIYNCDKETLEEVLNKHKWNRRKVGAELGIPAPSITRLIAHHQIKKEESI